MYIHAHTYTRVHTYMHVRTCTRIYIHTYIRVYFVHVHVLWYFRAWGKKKSLQDYKTNCQDTPANFFFKISLKHISDCSTRSIFSDSL